jgi:hypothetical protein
MQNACVIALLFVAVFGLAARAEYSSSRNAPNVRTHHIGEADKVARPLHYAPNNNFGANGDFLPGKVGFDLADLTDPALLSTLPADIKILVWVGQCDGISEKFITKVKPFLGDLRVFGWYLMDDPDPRSRLAFAPPCPPQNLRAESDWLHEHAPGTKTVVVLMNLSNARTPLYKNSYTPVNSHVDLYGLSAYPCRTEFKGCDYRVIGRYVHASDAAGIPRNRLIPVFQAFGGGEWHDDWNGSYIMPSAAQEVEIIRRWLRFVPHPVLDMAYSWGVQRQDDSLQNNPQLMKVFAKYHLSGRPVRP